MTYFCRLSTKFAINSKLFAHCRVIKTVRPFLVSQCSSWPAWSLIFFHNQDVVAFPSDVWSCSARITTIGRSNLGVPGSTKLSAFFLWLKGFSIALKKLNVKMVPGGGDFKPALLVSCWAGLLSPHNTLFGLSFNDLDFVFLRLKTERRLVAIRKFLWTSFLPWVLWATCTLTGLTFRTRISNILYHC